MEWWRKCFQVTDKRGVLVMMEDLSQTLSICHILPSSSNDIHVRYSLVSWFGQRRLFKHGVDSQYNRNGKAPLHNEHLFSSFQPKHRVSQCCSKTYIEQPISTILTVNVCLHVQWTKLARQFMLTYQQRHMTTCEDVSPNQTQHDPWDDFDSSGCTPRRAVQYSFGWQEWIQCVYIAKAILYTRWCQCNTFNTAAWMIFYIKRGWRHRAIINSGAFDSVVSKGAPTLVL